MITPEQLQDAARRSIQIFLDPQSGQRTHDPLPVLIPGDGDADRALIYLVSLAVGRDINPYNIHGRPDPMLYPHGVNLAPYLRSQLRRWAMRQDARS